MRDIEDPGWREPNDPVTTHLRDFRKLPDGRYEFTVLNKRITFELSRLRWQHHELWSQLTVDCTIPGSRTVDGRTMHAADFNVSAAGSRVARAKILAAAARTDEIDWTALIEELCQRTLKSENSGEPIVALADVVVPDIDDDHSVYGFVVPRRDIAALVSDGGKGKSGLALYISGELEQRGERILKCDYETDAVVEKKRALGMFGTVPAGLFYRRCTAPFIQEADEIRRQIVDQQITYGVLDSVVPACHDKAEESATAAALLRAQRATGIGWLDICHVSKVAERGHEKPFGSQFFWNEARSVWVLESHATPDRLVLACHHRKNNNGPQQPAVGFEFLFRNGRIDVRPCNVADTAELADGLPLWHRMRETLRQGPLAIHELADRLEAKPDTIAHTARRKALLFTRVLSADGIQRIGLLPKES